MPARRPLTTEQRQAAASSASHTFIVAAPGSGKTTVAAERYGVYRFVNGGSGLRTLGLSFARSATQELRNRVQGRWGTQAISWPHEIQTLDSLLYELVRHLLVTGAIRWPGGHTELIVLDTWRGQTGARYLLAEQGFRRVAALNGGSITSTGSRIRHGAYGIGAKKAFEAQLEAGVCTHDDIRAVLRGVLESETLRSLVAEYLTATISSLIVDEIFDANDLDLAVILLAGQCNIPTTLVGDPWQALYEFRGARPELVPNLVETQGYRTYQITHSFRFLNPAMRDLATQLRQGMGVELQTGSTADIDVVLAPEWDMLWQTDLRVLPLSFGRVDNQTDAAIVLLLDQVVSAHFGRPAIFAQEALTLLGLDPAIVRTDGAAVLRPVIETLSSATDDAAAAGIRQLRHSLKDLGSPRQLRALPLTSEAAQRARLLALALRLQQPKCIPGMTIHQAKGREWSAVGVRLKPSQIARIREGLSERNSDDRALYVALTRAREMVYLV